MMCFRRNTLCSGLTAACSGDRFDRVVEIVPIVEIGENDRFDPVVEIGHIVEKAATGVIDQLEWRRDMDTKPALRQSLYVGDDHLALGFARKPGRNRKIAMIMRCPAEQRCHAFAVAGFIAEN